MITGKDLSPVSIWNQQPQFTWNKLLNQNKFSHRSFWLQQVGFHARWFSDQSVCWRFPWPRCCTSRTVCLGSAHAPWSLGWCRHSAMEPPNWFCFLPERKSNGKEFRIRNHFVFSPTIPKLQALFKQIPSHGRSAEAVADPGFPGGERTPTPRLQLLFYIIFAENCMKMKSIGLRDTRVPPDPDNIHSKDCQFCAIYKG